MVVVDSIRKRSISSLCKHVIWKVNNSIRTRGLKRSIMLTLSLIGDFSFDFRYGTDTIGRIKLADLDIKSENKQRGRSYAPTKVRPFKKLMNTVNFPDNSVFVDFGSGKGRLLLLASQYHFKRVVGIEFSPQLCKVAKKNLSIFKEQYETFGNAEIIESDVVDYEIRDDENVFFLYNPFDKVVMNRVLRNITMSLEKKQRKIWLIYNNPVYLDIIESQGVFVKLEEFILGGNDFVVYMNNFRE